MPSTSSLATISVATVATGLVAYAFYFDHQRRANPDFRRDLRREMRRQVRAEKEEANSANKQKAEVIRAVVDDAADAGYPTGVNEKEQFFMEQVQQGEVLGSDPTKTLESAAAFYKALKVYPQPGDLISIYDKTVDKRVLDVLAEMIAYDKDLDLQSGAGADAGAAAAAAAAAADPNLPNVGLD